MAVKQGGAVEFPGGKAGDVERAEDYVRQNANTEAMERLRNVVNTVTQKEASDIFKKVSGYDAATGHLSYFDLSHEGYLTIKDDIYNLFRDPADEQL